MKLKTKAKNDDGVYSEFSCVGVKRSRSKARSLIDVLDNVCLRRTVLLSKKLIKTRTIGANAYFK